MKSDESWFDNDIAAMKLDYGEKAGLQIYRNYKRSFEEHAAKRFVEALDLETLDLDDLKRLLSLLTKEDARFLPVILCAFADEALKTAFKEALPDGVPGGKSRLFEGYGPLSSLAHRIQMAYAFDVLSADLMIELDRVRTARNRISHSWKLDDLAKFFSENPLNDMFRIEELLSQREQLTKLFSSGVDPLVAFRIRLIWIAARLTYEVAAFHRAKSVRLRPTQVLYGKPTPKWLRDVARLALDATKDAAEPS